MKFVDVIRQDSRTRSYLGSPIRRDEATGQYLTLSNNLAKDKPSNRITLHHVKNFRRLIPADL